MSMQRYHETVTARSLARAIERYAKPTRDLPDTTRTPPPAAEARHCN
jgi:hypothetical protein